MLICLLSGDTNPNTASVSVDAAQKIKPTCTIYTFTFYSLCSEIAGSIISFITLLDMMHQKFIVYRNTLNRTQGFTMDTRLTVLPIALTTVNDSFKIFCFSFFFLAVPFFKISIFTSGRLAVYVLLSICSQTSTSSDSDILLRKCCEGLLIFVLRARYKDYKQTICFWIGLLLHCCKQSVQVSHIHYAYAIFRVTFLVRFIIILVIPVINFTFIHKSWQQIRRGDAHDSRSQN